MPAAAVPYAYAGLVLCRAAVFGVGHLHGLQTFQSITVRSIFLTWLRLVALRRARSSEPEWHSSTRVQIIGSCNKDSLMALNQAPVGMVLRRELPLLSGPL